MESLIAILNISFIAGACWWFWRKQELPLRKFYWHAVAAKLSAGLLVGIIYVSAYATSDTFTIFQWATELSLIARTDFSEYLWNLWSAEAGGYFMGYDRTIFFTKIVSLFAFITMDNYWISSLYFSLISFFAALHLAKIIWSRAPGLGLPAVVAFLFFPTCVFWTSGILKESLAMSGLYFVAALFLQIWWKQKISIIAVLLAIISIWIAWNLKYYYVGLFVPILLVAWLTRKITDWKKIENLSVTIFLFLSMLLIPVVIAGLIHPNLSLGRVLNVLVTNNILFVEASDPDNVIHYYNLDDTWFSIIMNSPWALLSGLFRPFIWEAAGALKFFASIENLFLLALTFISLRSLPEIKKSPDRLLVVAILVYSCVLCIFLAISTPNFGTLVRYRIGFMPFLLFLLLTSPFIVRRLAKLFNVDLTGLPRS